MTGFRIPAAYLYLLVAFCVVPWFVPEDTAAQGPYRLKASVIGAAGGPGTGAGRAHNGTLGQSTPIGIGTAGQRYLSAGFWFGRRAALADTPALLPSVDALYQNYPNPFNPATTISFSLAEESAVTLAIYDLSGRRVTTLVHGTLPPGPHTAVWRGRSDDGRRVASGVYIYCVEAGDFRSTRKMILLK